MEYFLYAFLSIKVRREFQRYARILDNQRKYVERNILMWLAASAPRKDTDAALTAAIAGLGIAMGYAALLENDIRKGRLLKFGRSGHHWPPGTI